MSERTDITGAIQVAENSRQRRDGTVVNFSLPKALTDRGVTRVRVHDDGRVHVYATVEILGGPFRWGERECDLVWNDRRIPARGEGQLPE